jgi:hypothetical protein
MAIENAEVTRFLNEAVRPVAEKLRALRAEFASLDVRWQQISGQVSQTADIIVDGRADEGVNQLTGQDLHDLMYAVGLVNTQLQALAPATIEKACVRPFWV